MRFQFDINQLLNYRKAYIDSDLETNIYQGKLNTDKKNDDGVLETILWHKNGKKAALGVIDPKLQGMKGKYWNSKGEPVKSLKEALNH